MKKIVLIIIFVFLPFYFFGQEVVEKIEIMGNERVTQETILYYLSSREGDYFNREILKKDFRVLWSTGFFSNIKIEEEDGRSGKLIKIIVEENPVIKDIIYKTGKKVKENDIIDKLKEKDEYILPYSYYTPYKVQRVAETIKDLLEEKGLISGKVTSKINKKGKNEVEVVFNIDEGPKIKVGDIVFEGKRKLPESILMSALKENKKHGIISWIAGKDTFKKNKLNENLESLKKKYRERGYMEAVVGEPRIEDITRRDIFLRKKNMKRIVFPVDAGYLYFVGDVKIEGNKILSTKFLRSLIKFKEGEIYKTKVREKAVEEIKKFYGNFGYIYSQVMPVENLDPKRKHVNVTFNIYEGEVAYLNRLEFKGNNYTKDKVIRREFLLREGDIFSFAYFKNSLLRLNQLGLVELEGEPDIKPDSEDPTKINVNLNVKELQRNNIQFSAGYTGYEGTYVAASYSTVNFLGAGEKLELMFQYGKRIKNYLFGFTEPYLFDLPISLGFNLHDRYIIYRYLYNQRSRGVDFFFGARVKGYWRTNVNYSYDYVNINLPEEATEGTYNPYGYGYGYDPVYHSMYGLGNYNMSSITTSIYRNTVDSPLTPSRGSLYYASCKFAGGILGGDISIIKPSFEWTHFHPIIMNHSFGLHMECQLIEPIGGSDVPFWERFYLGGERSIRGYNIYTIGPRSESGTNMGGEKSLVFNAEYIIPVGGPLYAILFYDRGNAYAKEQKVSFKNMYSSTGLEVRVFVPALRIPFRLIFAYNSHKIYADDSNFAFRFAVGTTF